MMRKGFTLSEIMIALFVLSTTMIILSELQLKSIMKVLYGRQEIDRLYLVKKYAYNAYLYPQKVKRTLKQTHDDPEVKITVESFDVHKKSSLARYAKQLKFVSAQGEWERTPGNTKKLPIFTLVRRNEPIK